MIHETIDAVLPNLISAALSKPVPQAAYLKIKIRQIAGNKRRFFVEQFTSTQSFHSSMTRQEIAGFLKQHVGVNYKNTVIEAEYDNNKAELLHFLTNKKGKTTIIRKKLDNYKAGVVKETDTQTAPGKREGLTHNRTKNYLIEEGKPVLFLQHLGVMTAEGTVIADKYSKFKQINRFLEFIDDIIDEIIPVDGTPLSIVDFGCGKSYLTFAVYHYCTEIKKIPVRITGLDLKDDVITLCSTLAKEFTYEHLQFTCASIESYFENLSREGKKGPDLVISLHACDTATDYALASAAAQKTRAILCVPCCQHELNTAFQADKPASEYSPFLRFGLIRERFSSLATDLTRVLILEKSGYSVQVLEFIDFSHTPKNILIRAILKKTENTGCRSDADFQTLKKNLNKTLCLEKLLYGNSGGSSAE